ncbi:MAG: sugar ABC transporter substrate-binding protein [Candidatus Latescibacterota bacterium]|nr:sugar ABC transporter substrate-binding protein [Candidatus Latescibacterota bacterium]
MVVLCALHSYSCGSDRRARQPGEPVEVIVWDFGGVPGHREWIRGAVERFNSSRDDIRISLETRDWNTQRESLISSTIIGEGPDIIRCHHKYSVEFGQLGGLLDLERFEDWPEVKKRFFPNVLEHVKYDGKHYGVPVTMLPFVLAVNREIMEKYNLEVPKTWEEMLVLGPRLAEHGLQAFTMPAGVNLDTAYRFLPLLYGAGGRVFNEDWTRAGFNGPAGKAALRFLVSMKEQGFMPSASAAYAFDENAAHWSTGKVALSIEGPWWQNVVHGNFGFDTTNLQLAQVPVPKQMYENNPSMTLLDVIMVAITGYTPVPEQAWMVLKALNVEDPVWSVPDPKMGGIPTNMAAYAPGVQSDYIGLDQLAEAGAKGLGWPGHPAITEIQRYMADAVNLAMSGVMTPEDALDSAAAEVNEILSDY